MIATAAQTERGPEGKREGRRPEAVMSSSHLFSIALRTGRFWEIPRKSASQTVRQCWASGGKLQKPWGQGISTPWVLVVVVVVKYSSLSRSGVGAGAGILTMGADAISRGTLLLYRIKATAQKEESRDNG